MNDSDPISIENLQELRNLIGSAQLGVAWSVQCEVGPGWIGGGREVRLIHDGTQLSPTAFREKLISAIITAAAIPNETADSGIFGEGEIFFHKEKLMLEFEWTRAIPYDDPTDSGFGTVELSMD